MKEQIRRHFKLMKNMKQINLSETLGTLPHGEILVLSTVINFTGEDGGKPLCISQLAKELDATAPAVSRTLRKLEQKGYVQRTTARDDRRNTYVEMTDDGLKALYQSLEITALFMEKVFTHLTEEEAAQYFVLSEKLLEAVKQEKQNWKST